MATAPQVDIDGSLMEGGGQILRNAVVLSCLTHQEIAIFNIRGKRSNPGLRPQHMHGLRLVSELCNGMLEGDKPSSMQIKFKPGKIQGGEYVADTKTAGSVCLLMQISIPCLCFGDKSSTVVYKGGTNAEMAPPIDFYIKVFKPIASKFGIEFECTLGRRGFYPKGGGEVTVTINPSYQLKPVVMTEFGEVQKIYGTAYIAGALPVKIALKMVETAKQHLLKNANVSIDINVEKADEKVLGSGCGIIIYAETSTGCILSGSCISKKGKPAEEVGYEAANVLVENLRYQACVDSYLQDQLILFMALADGHSKIKTGPITMHTETAIYIAEKLTKAKFTVQKVSREVNIIECHGCSLKAS